jgi:hypothetical protein
MAPTKCKTCPNEARYHIKRGDWSAKPVYCGICDILHNRGRGLRAIDFHSPW